MRTRTATILICLSSLPGLCQTLSPKYQPGTVMEVRPHQYTTGEQDRDVDRYDVSVKVGNMVYVVLYTPPNGAKGVEYASGLSVLVLIGADTLTFNSKLSGTTQVPILRREVLASEKTLDWSKLPSQYFSMKQQHLSEALDLSQDQQTKIKPILEQEAGEAGQFLDNPVLSRKDQLERWEKLIRASDAQMKTLLSQTQVQKLDDLRQQQKKDMKKMMADQDASKQN